MSTPRVPHLEAGYHVLRYLAGTSHLGLLLPNSSGFSLRGFSNSDWASCATSRKSVLGFVLFLGDCPVSGKSKKQPTIALSSAEVEYRALRLLIGEITWLIRLLADLGVSDLTPVDVFCDNQAAVHIAKNPIFHECTKHIEVDCHFARNALATGLISLHPISTSAQLADIFTKTLLGVQQQGFLPKLRMASPSSLRGVGDVGMDSIDNVT